MSVNFWWQDHKSSLVFLVRGGETAFKFDDMVDFFTRASAEAGELDPALRARLLALAPDHPVRLGVVLNYVVTHYEVIKESAIEKRRFVEAFDELVAALDQLDEASYRDGQLIKKVLSESLEKYRASHGQA